MIMRRNKKLVTKLDETGKMPYIVPEVM